MSSSIPGVVDEGRTAAQVDAAIAAAKTTPYMPKYISGQWYDADLPASTSTATAFACVANTLYAVPFQARASGTLSDLGIEVGTGVAGSFRVGVGTMGADGFPAVLLADSGALNGATTGGKSNAVAGGALAKGDWYYVLLESEAATVVRGYAAGASIANFGYPAVTSSSKGNLLFKAFTAGAAAVNAIPADLSGSWVASTAGLSIPAVRFKVA